ncbi:sigma-70 family RNA polymerase sigma factor [Mesobacillus maritimus]|uniref:sigma-70 family RNA polymerase sigma factor n=1 Tax=Mesobacillus maritimus TaxID=1643336 RepID=UPI00384EF84C
MIPTKIEPNSNLPIRENSVDAIVDWFEQYKQSFYTIGLTYLNDQQQMEELFYRCMMKVQKKWPRFKSETSFDIWVTSIFIPICQELSKKRSLQVSEEHDPRDDIFKALHRLKGTEKEAIVLTYIKGFSQEESAHLLQVPVEKIKELLFSGIRSLRKELGYGPTYNGCREHHKDYIDYLERKLERSKKVDLEIHIFHCPNCQEDLSTFQEVMLTLVNLPGNTEGSLLPTGFMENVKKRLAEEEKKREKKNRKRKKMGLVSVAVFVLTIGIGFFTGTFSNLYYTWTEEDPHLRAFLQADLGERLNLETESDGVKMNIKSVIADDVQTLVFYEVEDTNEDNQYMIDFQHGVFVENAHEIMIHETNPRYAPVDLESDFNNKEKNKYHGKISLPPITTDNGTIKLNITSIQKLNRDTKNQNQFIEYENLEFEEGEWNFEIPVTKQPSTEYVLDEETKVEGIPVRFDKLTIAPTATFLQYSFKHEEAEKRIEFLHIGDLEINNKLVEIDRYSSSFVNTQQERNWIAFQDQFEPFFGKKPKEINVHFDSVFLTVDDYKNIELDVTKEYPQTFEYAGSTISIDKLEIGEPTTVVISNHEIENRKYESLQFHILSEDNNEMSSMNMDAEGVVVDKNGKEYDMNKNPYSYDEIEQPRHFFTVQTIGLRSNNGEKVIPKTLEIYGYNTTKYLDDVLKISLQ